RYHRQIVIARQLTLWIGIGDLTHDSLDILELIERRPSGVLASPVEFWRQPYREGLREILVGVLLRVPSEDVTHVMPRERIGAIAVAIRQGERPEDLRPLAAVMQPKGVVERVARLVSQVSHGLRVIFD